MHWARKCPHAREKQSALYGEAPELDEEEVHITLMAGNITNHQPEGRHPNTQLQKPKVHDNN